MNEPGRRDRPTLAAALLAASAPARKPSLHARPLRQHRWIHAFAMLGLLVIAGVAFSVERHAPAPGTTASEDTSPAAVSRDEAIADIEEWLALVRRVHPDADRRSAAHLDEAAERTIASLPERLTTLELFTRVAPLAASLHDSHTYVLPPVDRARGAPPIVASEQGIFLSRPHAGLPRGARVVRLGHRSADEVADRCRAWASAETSAGAALQIPSLVPTGLRWLDGELPAELTVRAPSGELVTVPAATDEAPPARDAIEASLAAPGVARLTIRSFAAPRRFYEAWFTSVFAEMASSNARGLIVDLRDNDGGNTANADLLLSYLTDRPYRLFGAKRWRVSAPMQQRIHDPSQSSRDYVAAEPGEVLEQVPSIVAPPARALRFHGPTVFLVGPRTRSAAMMLANAVEDFDLGILVGAPPSSPPNYLGEGYLYRMRHSRLEAMISSAAFVRANGDDANPALVQPHVQVDDDSGESEETVRVALSMRELETRPGPSNAPVVADAARAPARTGAP